MRVDPRIPAAANNGGRDGPAGTGCPNPQATVRRRRPHRGAERAENGL